MKNKLIKFLKCLIYLIPITIVFLYLITPFMKMSEVNVGHDVYFHFFRVREIEEAIRHFKFPIYMSDVKNVTSIDPIFYPYIFLYVPAIIDLFVKDINVAMNIFYIFVMFIYFAVAYYSAYVISKKHFISTIFSIVYPSNFYILYCFLARCAIGEYIALAFVPLFIAGVYNIFFDKQDKWYLLLISLLCIFQSHIITAFYVMLLLIIVCVIFIKKVFTKNTFIILIKTGTLFLLLNMWFIVPFLHNYLHGNANIDKIAVTSYLSSLPDLFFGDFESYVANYGSYTLIYIIISLLLISFLTTKKCNDRYTKIGIWTFVIFLFYLMMTFENPILTFLLSNKFIDDLYGKQQFSIRVIGRSLPYLSFSIAFLFAAFTKFIDDNVFVKIIQTKIYSFAKYILEVAVLVAIVIFVFVSDKNILTKNAHNVVTEKFIEYPNAVDALIEYTVKDINDSITKYENVRTEPYTEYRDIYVSSKSIRLNSVIRKYLYYDILYSIDNKNENINYFIDVPFRPYIGFEAYNIFGERIPIYYSEKLESGQKRMRIKLDDKEGRVIVRYVINPRYTFAKWISIIFVISFAIYGIIKLIPCKVDYNIKTKNKFIINTKQTIISILNFVKSHNVLAYIIVFCVLLIYVYMTSVK